MTQDEARGLLCGHCGGRHPTIDEVRACAVDTPIDDTAPVPVSGPTGRVTQTILEPNWSRLAGPDAIARGLLVGTAGEVPDPWSTAERVRLPDLDSASEADIDQTLSILQLALSDRCRVVIEIGGQLPDTTELHDLPLEDLEPAVELPNERLTHLVLTNSVDARDPQSPSIRTVDLAVAAGAAPSTGEQPGDVRAPDGTPLWCDGGRLEPISTDLTDHIGVVPLVHLRAGILRPVSDEPPSATDLSFEQLEAVTTRRGGARIVAPAGSGKTRVLTERARHLVNAMGIEPSVICLVAYNVRARHEMTDRTSDLPGLEVRTLNSLALAICRGTGPFRSGPAIDLRVIEERAVRDHIGDFVRPPRKAMTDPFAAWIEALSACRLGLRDPAEVEEEFDGDVPDLAHVLSSYRDRLEHRGELDFDEQIIRAIRILLTDQGAREAARRTCGVLLVDEFQDLTPAHLLLIRLLAGPAAEVFGVGDDDQTIYGYAGASPSWLIDFAKWFPGAGTHDLNINYRCSPEVIEAASNLLSHNYRRIEKHIEPSPDRPMVGAHDWPPLRRIADADPVGALSATISSMITSGTRPEEIAVLTRVNATLLAPMLSLRAAGITTTTPIDAAYMSRTGVAAALAWLNLSNSADRRLSPTDLTMASRRPPRGLSPKLVEWVAEQPSVAEIQRLASRLRNQRDREKIGAIADDIVLLHELASGGADTASILMAVRERIGLGGALETRLDASRRSLDRSSHGDDFDALISVSYLEPDPARFPGWLARQLEGPRGFDSDGVRLSTIHRVKGMEWPRVILFGADSGMFPHRLSSDTEEERRIFHVALTRSVDQTVIISGPRVSRFVAELDKPASPSPSRPLDTPSPFRSERKVRKPPRPNETVELSASDSELRDRLRRWRTETALASGVPAYVVADNRTIDAIAVARPTTNDALLGVPGIGPVKLERYGEAILTMVTAY